MIYDDNYYNEHYFINIERYAPFSYLHPITERSEFCKKRVISLINLKEKNYASRRADWITKKINPKSSLDIGTADGKLVINLLEKNIDAYGLDLSKYQINKLNKKYKGRFFLGKADKTSFKNNQFDLVTAFHVFEHIDPIELNDSLKEISRISKKYIVIEHPAKENFHVYVDSSHISVYNTKEWKKIITNGLGKDWKIVELKKATIYKPFFIYLEKTA